MGEGLPPPLPPARVGRAESGGEREEGQRPGAWETCGRLGGRRRCRSRPSGRRAAARSPRESPPPPREGERRPELEAAAAAAETKSGASFGGGARPPPPSPSGLECAGRPAGTPPQLLGVWVGGRRTRAFCPSLPTPRAAFRAPPPLSRPRASLLPPIAPPEVRLEADQLMHSPVPEKTFLATLQIYLQATSKIPSFLKSKYLGCSKFCFSSQDFVLLLYHIIQIFWISIICETFY